MNSEKALLRPGKIRASLCILKMILSTEVKDVKVDLSRVESWSMLVYAWRNNGDYLILKEVTYLKIPIM